MGIWTVECDYDLILKPGLIGKNLSLIKQLSSNYTNNHLTFPHPQTNRLLNHTPNIEH